MELKLSSALVSDKGYVRKENQDSGFAGARLLAIADGMGGHAGGAVASTIAIRTLCCLEHPKAFKQDVESVCRAVEKSILLSHDAIVGKARHEKALSGMGTTVDALILAEGYWILAHIGDSRAYLLRNGRLLRLTHDHSYVQYLIDSSRLTEAEAKMHPQKNVVMRVVGDFNIDPHPDISVRKARPGDRCLLCSDGLYGPLEDSTIESALKKFKDPDECAQSLANMALKAGSSDNVTAVIADCGENFPGGLPAQVAGAAEGSLRLIIQTAREEVAVAKRLEVQDSPLKRARDLLDGGGGEKNGGEAPKCPDAEEPPADTAEIPVIGKKSLNPGDPLDAEILKKYGKAALKAAKKTKKRLRAAIWAFLCLLLILALGAGGYLFYWSQTQYYVGEEGGYVAIYKGVSTSVLGIKLSHMVSSTGVSVSSLPEAVRQRLRSGIASPSLLQARRQICEMEKCQGGRK